MLMKLLPSALLLLCIAEVGAVLSTTTINPKSDMVEWVAAIFNGQGEYICAGSILTSQHVVTAASCFMNISNGFTKWQDRDAVIGVGSRLLKGNAMRMHLVASVTPHPSYNANNWAYHPAHLVDLAVLRLQTHIVFGSQHDVSTAVLGSAVNMQLIGQNSASMPIVVGWGPTSKTNTAPSNTMTGFKDMPLDDTGQKCNWGADQYFEWNQDNPDNQLPYLSFFDPETHLCMPVRNNKGASCSKDGGNPLVMYTESPKESYLFGIYAGFAPYGKCGEEKVTALGGTSGPFGNYMKFVSILKFGPWIQQVTGVLLPHRYPASPTPAIPAPPTPRRNANLFPASCKNRCDKGEALSASCWCDHDCKYHNDCCLDYDEECDQGDGLDQGVGCALPGSCGGQTLAGSNCWCDHECLKWGDCCDNYVLYCGKDPDAPRSCLHKCGGKSLGGCWCDENCAEKGDCCPDFKLCSSLGYEEGSCLDQCGKRAGSCWCDAGCLQNGDCCPNYATRCGIMSSCEGFCGSKSYDCWCDETCMGTGDCCEDFLAQCPDTHFPNELVQAKEQVWANDFFGGRR